MDLLVVDDHPIVREGMAALLRHGLEGASVHQAPALAEALHLLSRQPAISAVLLDLGLPGQSGVSAVSALRSSHPALPVVVLSASERPDDVRRAMAAGARGYIPKSTPPPTVLAAVRLVLSGGTYIPPLVMLDPAAPAARPAIPLTARQVEILRALSAGLPNKEIASRFGLSEKTVKAHVSAVFRSLHVVNRTQAAEAARRLGLLD